jgi:hypothetical protein
MTPVILERFESGPHGTFGRLTADVGDERHYFFTGELPWRDNQSNVSCIPEGIYKANFTFSPKFKRSMYEIGPVTGRTSIRLHSANLMGDTSLGFKSQLNGCISLGLKVGTLDGQKALLLSSPAMRQFETLMEGKPFVLEIKS